MSKIKIFVACHKPCTYYKDDVYTPIHVGRELALDPSLSDMPGDDTGENISNKNPLYSEMTAQYWVWKNLKDTLYVGFCHYRRYFDIVVNEKSIDNLFRKADVIMLGYRSPEIVEHSILRSVSMENLTIFLMVLKRKYPEYEGTVLNYLWSNKKHTNNMLICRKDLFDQYANWIFDLLFECEKYIRISPYTRERRVFGYLAEYFMPVFFIYNHYRIKEVGYVTFSDEKSSRTMRIIKNISKNVLFCISRPFVKKPAHFENYYNQAVLTGFANDDIKPMDSLSPNSHSKIRG